MRAFDDKGELRAALREVRGEGKVGLVPTMGYLHAGHVSLLAAARRDCHVVVLSLFVNPTQFGPEEDLEHYPRDLDGDLAKAERAGVDFVYAPPEEDLFPAGFATHVEVGEITEILCGAPTSRGPGHFRGVTTVVAKLLNVVEPDVAYFGQKDAQQAIVVRRMARDLDFQTRISVEPTVREPDGLAMSSRNAYLSPADRERAPALRRGLLSVLEAARADEPVADAIAAGRRALAEAGIDPEYLRALDAETLGEIETFDGRPVLIAGATQLGGARLIDNVIAEAADPGPGYRERTAAR